ncbi:virulence-associated E family protein [Mesorhizobium sp.]|uniref:virulence-associated E family protein n=1 Tax=Mesorhizobium sp. TaxID=1871066 RepID=UPI0025D77F08|nr:virulence-associated E family protein [Mesorhizobium sp.]
MKGDEDNVLHLTPRADEPDATARHVANPLNLRREMHRNALTKGLVRYNEFSQEIELVRPIPRPNMEMPKTFVLRQWSDVDDTSLIEHFNHRGFRRVGRSLVRDVIELEARSHPFHPVREYLDGLIWDGRPRLSRFFLDYCGAAVDGETEADRAAALRYVEAVTRCFFISAVARVYKPGCKADAMIVLEGPQGALKSQLLRVLATRDEWFSDSLPHDLESKDARAHLAGRWIVEMSEVAQFRRSEIETVKAFLSCQTDRYRPAYGRTDVAVPRQCVFAGSTNADTYLLDPTGNRRFWPLRVERIDLGAVARIVDQLWAEAVAAWRAGEQWWLAQDIEAIAADQQEDRVVTDPWHDQIADFVSTRRNGVWFTTAEVLSHVGIDGGRRDRAHEMRVGAVLRRLKCERKKRRGGPNKKPHWAYRLPPNNSEDSR